MSVRLTQTVQKGGCAAKVAAVELREILAQVRFPASPPELTIDAGTFDDAAIFRIHSELALVQTLDFFTPIVDSPQAFGRIAAANALSDVYAMGGKPVTAMSIFAFPLATMPNSVAVEILQGASDVIAEAGASLVGGHTIDDETLKFGLSVTGFVHPDRVWSNAGAQPGDRLILTKALGTGTLTAALKRGEATEEEIADGIASMAQLNDVTRYLTAENIAGIRAATDITGFGFAGHAMNLARASEVGLEIECEKLPRFARAMEFLERGFLTKAHRTNREYAAEAIRFAASVSEIERQLIFDPQTSGGLLLSVGEGEAASVLERLSKAFPSTREVGRVTEPSDVPISVR